MGLTALDAIPAFECFHGPMSVERTPTLVGPNHKLEL